MMFKLYMLESKDAENNTWPGIRTVVKVAGYTMCLRKFVAGLV
jgi:hypothetical protein